MSNSNLPKVDSLYRTCIACPSQWEGNLEDGRIFYIRYRWGYFSASVSKAPSEEVSDALDGIEILGIQYGDEYDGHMDEETMINLLKGHFDFSEII